ncbi:MAG: rRNA maturation RNAse YbeY, partial [Pseudomonadota bacterium]
MTDGAGAGAESGDDDDEHAERFETCSDEFTLSWQVQDSGWIEISEVLKSDDRAAGARQRVTDVLSDIFRAAEIGRTVEATIVFADDALVRDLNTSFRGKSTATNVLSFPAPADALNPDAAGISQPRYAGDVIIA